MDAAGICSSVTVVVEAGTIVLTGNGVPVADGETVAVVGRPAMSVVAGESPTVTIFAGGVGLVLGAAGLPVIAGGSFDAAGAQDEGAVGAVAGGVEGAGSPAATGGVDVATGGAGGAVGVESAGGGVDVATGVPPVLLGAGVLAPTWRRCVTDQAERAPCASRLRTAKR